MIKYNIDTIQKLKEINTLDEINSTNEIKELKKEVFKNKDNNINTIRKLMAYKKYRYDLNTITNEIIKNKLDIEVNTISEAIKKINSINLFKTLDLKSKIIEELDIPFKYKKYQLIANSIEELKNKLNINNTDNIIIEECVEDNTIYTVYEMQDCYYRINYSKNNKEYYISVYSNKNDETNYEKYYFSDIFQILFFNNYKDSIAKLLELLNITVTNTKEFIDMCKSNISYLELNINKYTFLKRILEKHIYIIKNINSIGIKDYYFKNDIKNDNEIFFSQRYIAKVCNKAQSTIMPYLNGLILLGFYKKRNLDNENYNKKGQLIYEIVPINEELLIQANEIAKILIVNKITMSKISEKNISKILGQDVANKIFLGNKS